LDRKTVLKISEQMNSEYSTVYKEYDLKFEGANYRGS